jgi:hypothetical protein
MSVNQKKETFTPEEEALIEVVYREYLADQTTQSSDEEVKDAINAVWGESFKLTPEVIICESPLDCKKRAKKDGFSELAEYWSMWYVSYASMYDFADRIGLQMNQENLTMFLNWVKCCPYVTFNKDRVYVSKKPTSIVFNDDGQLHNEEGKSAEFADGWGIYSINGVGVDEQIVMSPSSQTIKQIQGEDNEEVKRIRIERYGWKRFLDEISAELMDERQNDIDGVKEFLFKGDEMVALMCICNSTGKEFVLEVPPETRTCQQAQAWLSNGFSERTISSS